MFALDTWIVHLQGKCAAVIQIDATATLFNIKRLSSKTAAEIAFRLEAHDIMFTPEHRPSVLNFECDALSRLSQGATVSGRLTAIPRSSPNEHRPASARQESSFCQHALSSGDS